MPKPLAPKITDLQRRITHARALRVEAMRRGAKATVDALDVEILRLGTAYRAASRKAIDRHDVPALRLLSGPEAAQALREATGARA